MSDALSPQYEAFIRDQLAMGVFATREQVIEAGLDALQRREEIPLVPTEHEALLEEAEADFAAGRVIVWNYEEQRARLIKEFGSQH